VLTLAFNVERAMAEDNLLLEMQASKTLITIGEEVNITLIVTNVGNTIFSRTYYWAPAPRFDAYYFAPSGIVSYGDGTVFIPVVVEFTLEPGENITRTLRWDLYQHIDEEYYPPVPGNYNLCGSCDLTHDGIFDLLFNPIFVTVTIVGDWWNLADVNFDFEVDIYDVVLAVNAYGSTPLDPDWNPHCDIAEPYGVINIYDIVMICSHYGETYP